MITMQNIADKAGVSKGTVSYVLNGKHKKARINEETCTKIITIAEQLGYRRNAIAQSMKTGKTNVIGVIGGLYSSYCMEIIKGINTVISRNNYLMKLLPTETAGEIKNVARQCVEQRLAGVICRSLSEQELKILHTELRPNNIPIVLVDSSFSHNWCSRVTSDDFTGAGMATEYLLKLGHRRIGHVTNSLNRGFSKIRYDGYIRMMSEWGIKVSQKNICVVIKEEGDILEEQRDKITAFLKQQKPTAVFCGSDPVAMKVLNIAQDIGLKIPEDLSVIGFAGLDYTACASPSLTTIKQPFTLMGRKVGEILLAEIKDKIPVKERRLPVELIIRDSCSKIISDNT